MMNIYDGNSHVRRMLEADASGRPFRSLSMDVVTNGAVNVYVWDSMGGNARRRAIYPAYKADRKPMGEDIFTGINLFKDVLNHTPAVQITVPGFEGDDVIAAVCMRYAGRMPITIHSSDRDLCALLVLDGVNFAMETFNKCSPDLIPLYKATVGDPSDNIRGIKGFGGVSWAKADKDSLLYFYSGICNRRLAEDFDAQQVAKAFNMPLACARWLIENEQEARAAWEIVHFQEVSVEELENNSTVGTTNLNAIDEILTKWMQ